MLAAYLVVAGGACNRSSVDLADAAMIDATPEAPGPERPTGLPACKPAEQSFTLGEATDMDSDAGEDDLSLPFAPELGTAASYPGGFAIGLLATTDGATRAALVLVPESGGAGQVVSFGRTHGPVAAPQVVSRGKHVVVGIMDSDAGGNTVRLASVSIDSRTPSWGPDFPQGRDESNAFDIELGDERGLLVWDDLDKPKAGRAVRSVLRTVHFDTRTLAASEPALLAWNDIELEAPKLARRGKGFWLAAVQLEPVDKKAPEAEPTENSALANARQQLAAVALDARGGALGAPIAVSEPNEHVLAFDIGTNASGGAVLVWRSDVLPGIEASAIRLARVQEDGTVQRSTLELEAPPLGVPALLQDGTRLWLGVRAPTGLELLQLGPEAIPVHKLEAALRGSEALAVSGRHALIAQSRGLQVELVVARCPQP